MQDNKQIVLMAQERAIAHGYDRSKDESLNDPVVPNLALFFSLDFAKAFFGEEIIKIEGEEGMEYSFPSFEYHLQMLVLEENKLKYLEDYMVDSAGSEPPPAPEPVNEEKEEDGSLNTEGEDKKEEVSNEALAEGDKIPEEEKKEIAENAENVPADGEPVVAPEPEAEPTPTPAPEPVEAPKDDQNPKIEE